MDTSTMFEYKWLSEYWNTDSRAKLHKNNNENESK